MLEFDEPTHTYKIDGSPVPSVTKVVDSVFPWIPPPGTTKDDVDFWRQRGLATHHGCRLLDEGRLDWGTVAPQIKPRIEAWKRFREDLAGNRVVESEKRLGHATYRFAGTLDRLFENKADFILCDIKSNYSAQHRLQLGGYSLLVTHNLRVTCKGAVIVVVEDSGKYKCHWITAADLRSHERQFLAALTVHNFGLQYGLKGEK